MKEREWKQTSKRETQSVPRAESCDAHIAAPGTIILSKWQRQIQIHKDKYKYKWKRQSVPRVEICDALTDVAAQNYTPKMTKASATFAKQDLQSTLYHKYWKYAKQKNVIFQVCERTPYPTCTCLTLWPSPPHYLFYTCKGSQEHFGKHLTSVITHLAPTSSTPSISTSFS